MKNFYIYVIVLLCSSGLLFGQLSVTFTPDKTNIVTREPVYINIDIKNESKGDVSVEKGGLYGFCSGIIFQQRSPAACEFVYPGGSCPSGGSSLKPGESYTERVLLNHFVDFKNTGEYKIEGIKYLHWAYGKSATMREILGKEEKKTEFIYMNVEKATEEEQQAIYAPYLAKLKSSDPEVRNEALRIVSEAPSMLGETALLNATREDTVEGFVIKGLKELNTQKARDRIMELAEDDVHGYTQTMAIQALGEMEDRSYVSRLKVIADKNSGNSGQFSAALNSIAELEREDSVLYLYRFLQSEDAFKRGATIRALSRTRSKLAVTTLIPLLKDEKLKEVAHAALQVLSRRKGPMDYQPWMNWWSKHQKEATIYGSKSCDPIRSLESEN